jgi:hypothetical protein
MDAGLMISPLQSSFGLDSRRRARKDSTASKPVGDHIAPIKPLQDDAHCPDHRQVPDNFEENIGASCA